MTIKLPRIANVVITSVLIVSTFTILSGNTIPGIPYPEACVITAMLWLARTRQELSGFLEDFFDTRMRARLRLSIWCGSAAAFFALFATAFSYSHAAILNVLAGATLFGWGMILTTVYLTRKQYKRFGRGLVHKDTWVNPHPSVLRLFPKLFVFISTGIWWEPIKSSLGHEELGCAALDQSEYENRASTPEESAADHDPQFAGADSCVSSCSMEYGTYVHSLGDAIRNCLDQKQLKEGYEGWLLAVPTEAAIAEARAVRGDNWEEYLVELVRKSKAMNMEARDRENARRAKLIMELPFLSQVQKRYWRRKLHVKGYQWSKMAFSEADRLIADMQKRLPRLAWLLFGDHVAGEAGICSTHVEERCEELGLTGERDSKNYTPYGFLNPTLPLEIITRKNKKGERYWRLVTIEDARNLADYLERHGITDHCHVFPYVHTSTTEDCCDARDEAAA